MLFFNRADHFSRVWAEVKKARPDKLFLYQDGPRANHDDMPGILACRALVSDENIDWPCEVHRLYQPHNYGCDPSGFMSQRWAFSQVDRCIVLEDDVVPSQSFFRFAEEMLIRYLDDERVTLVSGFNTDEDSSRYPSFSEYCGESDYFFTRAFSIWGWASWARVVNNWDGNYGFVSDPSVFRRLKDKVRLYHQRCDMPRMCQAHAASGKQYFESIFWSYMLLHDGLAVMPRLNLINNIGMEDGAHYSTQMELMPRRLRKQFTMKRHDLQFPLVHPMHVSEYPDYQRRYYLRNAWNAPWRKIQYSVEELILNLRHGNFSNIKTAVIRRIKKICHLSSYS